MSFLPAHLLSLLTSDPRTGGGLATAIGALGHDGTSYYEKVASAANDWRMLGTEKSNPGSNVTSVTFSTIGGVAMNGDRDGGYLIEGWCAANGGTVNLTIRPNGLTTNQDGRRCEVTGGVAGSGRAELYLATAGVGNPMAFRALFSSRTGRARFFICMGHEGAGGNTGRYFTAMWNETVTNITSIDIVSDIANGIASGARFTITRLGNPLL